MNMSNDEYVKARGLLCPVCKSNDIGDYDIDITEDFAHITLMECYNCETRWTSRYKLVGYTLDEPVTE